MSLVRTKWAVWLPGLWAAVLVGGHFQPGEDLLAENLRYRARRVEESTRLQGPEGLIQARHESRTSSAGGGHSQARTPYVPDPGKTGSPAVAGPPHGALAPVPAVLVFAMPAQPGALLGAGRSPTGSHRPRAPPSYPSS